MKQITKLKKQLVEKNRREGKGRVISLSRNIYKITDKNTYYVESESCDSRYYFVRYNPSVFEWCSCFDNSRRNEKCKHIFAIEFGSQFNTIKEVDKLPSGIITTGKLDANVKKPKPNIKKPKGLKRPESEYNHPEFDDPEHDFEYFETNYIDSVTLVHDFKCIHCSKIKSEYEQITTNQPTTKAEKEEIENEETYSF